MAVQEYYEPECAYTGVASTEIGTDWQGANRRQDAMYLLPDSHSPPNTAYDGNWLVQCIDGAVGSTSDRVAGRHRFETHTSRVLESE